jgi:hypothetical protein
VNIKDWEESEKTGKKVIDKSEIEWVDVSTIVEGVNSDIPKPEGWDKWLADYKQKHEKPGNDNKDPPQAPQDAAFKVYLTPIAFFFPLEFGLCGV